MEIRVSDSEIIIEEEAAQGINSELLLKVAEYIEGHPKEFDMSHWRGHQKKQLPNPWYRVVVGLPAPTEACGTTYCMAGWTVALSGGDMAGNLPAQAQRLLSLSLEQAQRLFYEHNWPQRFRGSHVKHDADRVWLASERIRHFIATNGAE